MIYATPIDHSEQLRHRQAHPSRVVAHGVRIVVAARHQPLREPQPRGAGAGHLQHLPA